MIKTANALTRIFRSRVPILFCAWVVTLSAVSVPSCQAELPCDGWLIQWNKIDSPACRQTELAHLGYTEKKYYPLGNLSWVKAASDTAVAPDHRFSPNYIGELFATVPNDSSFVNYPNDVRSLAQTYINLPAAWDYTQGSSDVRIAILDSGIDTSHLDLKDQYDTAVSFVTGDAFAGDKNGHGTAVAALLAGKGDNKTGIAGVCWKCRIVSVKVIGNNGRGTSADLAEGLRWAAQQPGVRVINMSMGFPNSGLPTSNFSDANLEAAVKYAYDQGILLVGAAGDSGNNGVEYPARYDQVMSVGAIDPTDGTRWSNSNYKDGLELMAPGVGVFSDTSGDTKHEPKSFGNGTSFAAPLVAGVAALVWSEQPGLSRQDVWDRINGSTKDLNTPGWDEQTGFGSVDAAAALRVAAFRVKGGKDVISFPNPFHVRAGGNITIRPSQDVGVLTVKLFSLDGRLLQTLSGTNEVQWDGKTSGGQLVSAGIYLYQASADNVVDEGRITVIDW